MLGFGIHASDSLTYKAILLFLTTAFSLPPFSERQGKDLLSVTKLAGC